MKRVGLQLINLIKNALFHLDIFKCATILFIHASKQNKILYLGKIILLKTPLIIALSW